MKVWKKYFTHIIALLFSNGKIYCVKRHCLEKNLFKLHFAEINFILLRKNGYYQRALRASVLLTLLLCYTRFECELYIILLKQASREGQNLLPLFEEFQYSGLTKDRVITKKFHPILTNNQNSHAHTFWKIFQFASHNQTKIMSQ